MLVDLPTLTRETLRLMSTGVLPRDAFDGPVPDGAFDGDTERASDDEEDSQSEYPAMAKALVEEEADKARRLRMLVDYASEDEDEDRQSNADDEPAAADEGGPRPKFVYYEEDGKYYGPRYELHPDYESYPANEPEPEDDGGEPDPDFLGPRVPSPRRSPEVEGAATNYARNVRYDDDVIVIKADQGYHASSSSSGSGSPSGSDRSSSPERFDDQDEQLARDEEKRQQQLAAAKEKPHSPTPDVDGIPHFASEDIDMSSAYTLSLELKSDDEILAGFFGEGHGAVLSNIHPTPPTPSAGQNAPPAPPAPAPAERMAIRPELAKRLEEVTRPRNVLKRTMNGDAYIPDGAGGFMSARTGRHVEQAFAGDFLQRQEDNTLRNLAQRINAGQVVVTVVQDQPASPTSPSSGDDAESVDEQLDASTSDEEVVEAPTRKRARDEEDSEDNDGDEASSEKRRRVQSEEQPGSRAVLRLRSRAPSPSPALGSSTAATQQTLQLFTAAAAAPHADGAAVVEPTERAATGSDETPTASTPAPAAEIAQEPTPSANVPARRSTRIRAVADVARVKAAEAARRAAEAAPVPKQRGKGKGKGKGKGGA